MKLSPKQGSRKFRWHGISTFSLADFVKDNRDEDYVIKTFVPEFLKLKVGESYIYDGGAGGVDKFTRVK